MRERTVGKAAALLTAMAVTLALAGCSGYRTYRRAQIAEQSEDWDAAVLHYMQAVEADPGNISYRAALLRAKIRASQEHFERAKTYHETGALERALIEYQQAVALDPTNQYAAVELGKVREEMASREGEAAPLSLEEMKVRARERRQPPVLDPRSDEPISLDFPRPVSIFDIYRALGKAFGINVLFDPRMRDQEIAIELRDVTAQTALETLMRAGGHFYKVLDEHSIIIADDNPQNRRIYEDLVIQTFFLSNADVKEVMTMLRSLVGAKNLAQNEQQNAIILRDTADKVRVAERIIEANDKARGEVVVDVELLQINTSKLRDLGVSLSAYQVTQTLDLGGEDVPIRFSDLEFINQSNWVLTIPSFVYDFVKNATDAQLLAKPQVRISDGEKARLHIGDRVPIPVTQFNTAQTIGGNIVPITSFQYQDVGIRIEIEPRIHHNKEITLVLKVEVSNLSGFVEGTAGQRQPIIGTRTIESTIRLKDGETNFLAGLIRSDESNTETGMPGISEIPVLGRLFSKTRTDKQRTDVVLTMTPHIIRVSDITAQDLEPIWVGTEANITFRSPSPRVESEVEGPFEEGGEATPEQIQEMIRRRIQNLPRGLRDVEPETTEPPVEPTEEPIEEEPGVDVVEPGAPTDIFTEPEPEEEPIEEEPPPEEEPIEEEPPGGGLAALAPAAGALRTAAGAPTGTFRLTSDVRLVGERGSAPLSGAAPPSEPAPVDLVLLPGELQVAPGQSFELFLAARAGVAVSHLPARLAFDPAVLVVEAVEAGSFLGGPGEVEVLGDRSHPGRLVLGASRLGRVDGVSGSGVVARIRMRAIAAGISEVRFEEGGALDPDLRTVSGVRTWPARVEVVPGAPGAPGERGPFRPEIPREGM